MVTLLLRVHASGAGPMGATVLLLCISLPSILTMGLAGSLADRYNARLLLTAGGLAQAASLAALALRTDLPTTYALTAVGMLAVALSSPVWTSVLPSLLGEEHTGVLVSAQQGLRAVAMPGGAALAGVIAGVWGQGPAMLTAAGLAALSGLLPLGLRIRRTTVSSDEAPLQLLPISALRALREHRIVYVFVVSLLPFVVAAEAVNAVEVFLVRDDLGATASQFGLATAAAGIGTALGALAAGLVTHAGRRIPVTLLTLAVFALTQAGQGIAPTFWVFLWIGVICGVAVGLANALIFVVLLDQTPEHVRGRVIALVSGLSRVAAVGATGLGGALGALVGARWTFVIAGGLGLLTVLGAALALRGEPTHTGVTGTAGADTGHEADHGEPVLPDVPAARTPPD